MEEVKEVKKKNKKGLKVFLILFGILILITVGFFIVMKKTLTAEYFLNKTNKKITNIINVISKNQEYNSSYDMAKDYSKITGDANITTNIEEIKYLNNLKLDYRYILSIKDEYMDLGLNFKQNDGEIPFDFYMSNTNLYIDSDKLNINLLALPLEENPFNDIKEMGFNDIKISSEDINYVLKNLSSYLMKSLEYAKMETINDGSTIKYKYIIDNSNNDNKVITSFIEQIKNDSKLMKILKLEEDFDNSILSSDNYLSYLELLVVHKPFANRIDEIKIDYKIKNGTEEESDYLDLKRIDKEKYRLSSIDGYFDIIDQDNKITFKGYDDKDTLFLDLTISIIEKNILNLDADFFDKDNVFKINVDIKLNDANDSTFKGYLSYTENNNNIKVDFELNQKTYNDSVNKKDFKNATKLEELTEEDVNKISKSLEEQIQNFEFMKIYETVENNPNINLGIF